MTNKNRTEQIKNRIERNQTEEPNVSTEQAESNRVTISTKNRQNVRTESLSETDAMVNIDTMLLPIPNFLINASFLFFGSPTK
jgi:hypothetical protein